MPPLVLTLSGNEILVLHSLSREIYVNANSPFWAFGSPNATFLDCLAGCAKNATSELFTVINVGATTPHVQRVLVELNRPGVFTAVYNLTITFGLLLLLHFTNEEF